MTLVIKPIELAPVEFKPGDSAFFVDDGKRIRVKVRSDRHDALGQPTRTVLFMDEGGEYDVLEKLLEPCGPRWQAEPVPTDLQSPAKIGAPRYPDPYKPQSRPAESVLDRYGPKVETHVETAVARRSGLTDKQLDTLAEGAALCESKNRNERAAGRRMLIALQAEIVACQNEHALSAALADMKRLSEGRGSRIVATPGRDDPKAQRLSIPDHDGLLALFTRDHQPLRPAEWQAGLRYRAGYEKRSGDLGAATMGETSSPGHDNNLYVLRRLKNARALQLMHKIDLAVVQTCKPNALAVLRWVAGQSHSLRSMGGGRGYATNFADLQAALRAAIPVIKAFDEEEARRAALMVRQTGENTTD